MRYQIPSTFKSASAMIGQKSTSREIQSGVLLRRESGERIVCEVDHIERFAYLAPTGADDKAGSVEIALGERPSSKVLGIARAALSACASTLSEMSESKLERARATLEQYGADPDLVQGGVILRQHGKADRPLTDGTIIPVLA